MQVEHHVQPLERIEFRLPEKTSLHLRHNNNWFKFFIKKTFSVLKKYWWIVALLILLTIIIAPFLYLTYLFSQVKNSFPDGSTLSLVSFIKAANTKIKGEDKGRTNILVYGLTADESRTDSILLVSYYWREKKLVALNIPRDLYINYKDYKGKIVSLYEIEKNNHPDDKNYPPMVVSNFISSEFNIPIDYYFVNNFNALKEIVDTLGGITVTVDRSFSDPYYPDNNYGYLRPIPNFTAGTQVMNGTQALIFSRSRQSQDQPLEGTDFARSLRQEKVLQAIMSKLKSQSYLTDLSQLSSYLGIFGRDAYTNMDSSEMIKLVFTLRNLNLSTDYLKANWNTSSGFLCDSNADGQYVLKYGTLKNCQGIAGINDQSPYRKKALDYVQNLINYGSP